MAGAGTTASRAARATTRSTAAPATTRLEVQVGPGDFSGDDTVVGGTGDDTMRAGVLAGGLPDGGDGFTGGLGRDRIDYSARTSPVSVRQDGAANDGQSGEGDNVATDVEVITGGSANDVLVGGAIANLLEGGVGEDLLQGGAGNDTLDGGAADAGGDTLEGGEGDDSTHGGPGDDRVDGGNGRDFLDGGSGSDTATGDAGDDSVLGGAGIDSVSGGAGNDNVRGAAPFFIGADGADAVKGDGGDDALQGDAGDDTLEGGFGADAVAGGADTDTTDYADRTQDVAVLLDGKANDGAPGERDNKRAMWRTFAVGASTTRWRATGSNRSRAGRRGLRRRGGGRSTNSGRRERRRVAGRDGTPDRIVCGDGPDFVIADWATPARDCDRVDAGRSAAAPVGPYGVVRPRKGTLASPPPHPPVVPLRT